MRPETKKAYPKDWPQITRRLVQERGGKCERCKLPPRHRKPLTVHHIDGNPANNEPSNLVVLCSPCHLRVQNDRTLTLRQLGAESQLPLFNMEDALAKAYPIGVGVVKEGGNEDAKQPTQ